MPDDLEETDLHPLRREFADLVTEVERCTGHRLHVAHTVTLLPATLDSATGITRRVLADGKFRLLSFLPLTIRWTGEQAGGEFRWTATEARLGWRWFGRTFDRPAPAAALIAKTPPLGPKSLCLWTMSAGMA